MATIPLPDDDEALAGLYQETIDHHRTFLDQLHKAFDKKCDAIGAEAEKKLKALPEDDAEGRAKVAQEEKQLLAKTLAELKYAISKSEGAARKKLEEIQTKLEQKSMNLDEELAGVEEPKEAENLIMITRIFLISMIGYQDTHDYD